MVESVFAGEITVLSPHIIPMAFGSNGRKGLVCFVGTIQLLHFGALILDLKFLIQTGSLRLLAPDPVPGWSSLQLTALIIMGTLDMFLILGFAAYAWLAFRGNRQADRTGLVVLSGFQITALAYALVIVPSGAIRSHPLNYLIIAIAFLPVLLLWINLMRHKV